MEQNVYPEFPVLVVDDDKDFLNSIDYTLRSKGITNLDCCDDSLVVLSRLERKKYSVILLDLKMKGKTGEELLTDIVKDYPDISVIIMTGFNEVKIAVRCMKKGANDYIVKPPDSDKLIELIKDAVANFKYKLTSLHGKKMLKLNKEIQEKLNELKRFENELIAEDNFLSLKKHENFLLENKNINVQLNREYNQMLKKAEPNDNELIVNTGDHLKMLSISIDRFMQILQKKKLLYHYQVDGTAGIVSEVLKMADVETLIDIETVIVNSDEIEDIIIHKVVADIRDFIELIDTDKINCTHHALKKIIKKAAQKICRINDIKKKFNLYLPFIPIILFNKGEFESTDKVDMNFDIELKFLEQKWEQLLGKFNQKERN